MTAPHGPTKYVGPDQVLVPFVSYPRRPTGADYRQPSTGRYYVLGTIWQVAKNPTTGVEGELWLLSKIVANVAFWITVNQGGNGPIVSLSDTDDTKVFADGLGNVKLQGTSGEIDITSDPVNHKLVFSLPGEIVGTATTNGAETKDVITIDMGLTANAKAFDILVIGLNTSTPAAGSYSIIGGVRSTGAAAGLLDVTDVTSNEETAFEAADADLVVSGNNAIVRVTGIAGLIITWTAKAKVSTTP